ncbi:chlorophyll a/b-binding protein domain-containing protein [Baffinella frigidus]|nr:chlorophyll a/b-binding protein domain-containing protein [Cryptophyta sp. CCMP2293]
MFTRSFLIAALAFAGAEAFAPGATMIRSTQSGRAVSSSPLRMQVQEEDKVKAAVPARPRAPAKVLDGKMPGDKGFDPLGFADSVPKLRIYREAELKHGRLAMLAALGWPVAEELNGPISKAMGMQSTLVGGLDPSILNGGLEAISPIYWGGVFMFGAITEIYASKMKSRAGFRATMAALGAEDITGIDIDGDGQVGSPKMLAMDMSYMPGDLGFDPLGLYKGSERQKADLQLKEVNNGRLAMVGITGYAIQEAISKISVVSELGIPAV